MPWKLFAYALLCVLVPLAWGLMVYWVSSLIERRVLRKLPSASGEADESLSLEYYI